MINAAESESFLGHDVVEILPGYLSPVGCCSLKHFFEFLDIHGLAQFFGHSADVVGVDEAGVVVVEEVEDFVDAVLDREWGTLLYLSPSLEVIPSKNYSKVTSLPWDSRAEIMLKMVGFLL